jgi:phosphatidylglycerophosphate synthase
MSETKRAYSHLLYAPNLLTFSRVILAAIFFVFIPLGRGGVHQSAWYLLALLTFLLAVLTDWLDGYVARRYHLETAFGRVADPFVDKLLVCGGFIMFAFYLPGNPYMAPEAEGTKYLANVAPWMVVIITGREFLISALRGYAESMNIKFGANVWGKQKMFFQSVAICAILANHAVFDYHAAFAWFTTALIWLAVAWTILSGVLYISRAKRVLKNEPA